MQTSLIAGVLLGAVLLVDHLVTEQAVCGHPTEILIVSHPVCGGDALVLGCRLCFFAAVIPGVAGVSTASRYVSFVSGFSRGVSDHWLLHGR